jgi:hypothetical protein
VRELKVNTIVLQFLHLPSFTGIEPFRSAFTRFSIVGFIRFSMESLIRERRGLFHRSRLHRPHDFLISSAIDRLSMQQGE